MITVSAIYTVKPTHYGSHHAVMVNLCSVVKSCPVTKSFPVSKSCPTPCNPMGCSLPGSSVHGIPQARTLEWVAMPSSRESSDPGIEVMSPAAPELQADSLPLSHWGSPTNMFSSVQFSSVAQSCLTLCDPMNCSTPGLPVHHHLPEVTQTHDRQVSDAIQPSHQEGYLTNRYKNLKEFLRP